MHSFEFQLSLISVSLSAGSVIGCASAGWEESVEVNRVESRCGWLNHGWHTACENKSRDSRKEDNVARRRVINGQRLPANLCSWLSDCVRGLADRPGLAGVALTNTVREAIIEHSRRFARELVCAASTRLRKGSERSV